MSGSGTETRQRQIVLKARFTDAEAALIRAQADRAGVSVAALIRFALLDQRPLRASRRPSLDHEIAARLLGKVGQLSSELRAASDAEERIDPALIAAAHRDIADMRFELIKALGRAP